MGSPEPNVDLPAIGPAIAPAIVPAIVPAIAKVLSISPSDEDRRMLYDMLGGFHWTLFPNLKWEVHGSSSVASAVAYLRMHQMQVVLCDADSRPGSWSVLLRRIAQRPWAPPVIVTSRQVDAHLWAEATYLGAHGVLSKPFGCHEVRRLFRSAWLLWNARNHIQVSAAVG